MIDPNLPAAVAAQLDGRDLDGDSLSALRKAYPDIHFTACIDDDVVDPIRPYVTQPGLNIYLVDGNDHCMTLTTDTESATGLLLAEVVDEDE